MDARDREHPGKMSRPGFAEECLRQSRLVARADRADADMQQFTDEALAELDGWTK
jgi:hypothetical protein